MIHSYLAIERGAHISGLGGHASVWPLSGLRLAGEQRAWDDVRYFRGVTESRSHVFRLPGEDRNTIGILEIFHIQINKNHIYMKISWFILGYINNKRYDHGMNHRLMGIFFCFIMCFGFANLIYVGVSENGGWHKCRWTLCVHYHWECTIGNGPPIVCHSKNKRTWIGRKRRSYTFLNHDWLVVWNMFFLYILGNVMIPTDELHHFSEG